MLSKTLGLLTLSLGIAVFWPLSLSCVAQDPSSQRVAELQKKLEGAVVLGRYSAGVFISEGLIALPYDSVRIEIEEQKRRRTTVRLARDQTESGIECRIIAHSRELGIAILRSLEPVDVDPVELADSKQIRPGDPMHVFHTHTLNSAGGTAPPYWIDDSRQGAIRSATGGYIGLSAADRFSVQALGVVFDGKGALVSVASSKGTCDVIRRALEGSIVDAKIEWDKSGSNGNIKLKVIDAIRNFQEVRMAIWSESPWKAEDRIASEESIRNSTLLELDAEEATWKATIQAKNFPNNKLLWGMALLTSKEGERAEGPFLLKVPPEMTIENPYKNLHSTRSDSPNKPYSDALKKSLVARFQSGEKGLPDANLEPTMRTVGVSEAPDSKVLPNIIQFEKGNPISIVSHPSGSHIFVVVAGDPFVYVFKTTDFSLERKLPVPLYPSSAWCGNKELAVASVQSKVITFYDLETYSSRTLQLKRSEDSDYHPISFSGLAPDGSLMSVWDRNSDQKMFLLHPNKSPLCVGLSRGTRFVLPKSCDYLLVQKENTSLPGIPDFIDITNGNTERITASKRFNKSGIGKHTDTGKIQLSEDGENMFVPQAVDPNGKPNLELGVDDQYRFRTYVLTVDFQSKIATLPGYVIQEIPQQELLVSWGAIPSKEANDKKENDMHEVLFIHRRSGKVIKRIQLEKYYFRENPNAISNLIPIMTYVPGRDLIVIADGTGRVCIYECGSPQSNPTHRVTSSESAMQVSVPRLKNSPPTQLYVGKEFHFIPELQGSLDSQIKFLLTKGLPRMKIDEKTGRIDFTAQPFHIGQYEMRIELEIEGQRYLLTEWILNVQK